MTSMQNRWPGSVRRWWWLVLLAGSWLGILYIIVRQETHPVVTITSLVCLAAGAAGAVTTIDRTSRLSRDSVVCLWRTMQHGLLNHLQVAGGWLQLGQPEQAQGFIVDLTARINDQRAFLARIGRLRLDSQLVAVIGRAEATGIELTLCLDGDAFPGPRGAATMVHLAHDLVERAAGAVGSVSGVGLSISDDGGRARLLLSASGNLQLSSGTVERFLVNGGWSGVSVEAGSKHVSISATATGR